MGVINYLKQFKRVNIDNGELYRHKGGYLAAAVLGYALLSRACGCAPVPERTYEQARAPSQLERIVEK